MKNHVNIITLKGRINVELIPASNWRELAKRGIKSMKYVLSGTALIEDEERSINITIPALADGILLNLGSGKPWGNEKLENTPFLMDLYPKNARLNDAGKGLDVAILATDDQNKIKIVDNHPVYLDATILIEEGEDKGKEFDLFFGTYYYITNKRGLTLECSDVSLTETNRPDRKGGDLTFVDATAGSFKVVPATSARANGEAMPMVCKAARVTTKAVPEVATAITDGVVAPVEHPTEV